MRRPDDVRPGPEPRDGLTAAGPLSLGRTLSKLGVCSRREAERWIADGRVRVNGRVERSPRPPVDLARDAVLVDGLRVAAAPERLVLALHKPTGLVTTRSDPGGRPTVYEALAGLDHWVFPVGRLDRDTSGLLIFTNDPTLGARLTDPKHHVPRTYHARVHGHPDEPSLQALREGVDLGRGVSTLPATVRLLGSPRATEATTWLEIVLTEGQNRQVRRMCAHIGHDVLDLVRVRIGRLDLAPLAPGEWRTLPPPRPHPPHATLRGSGPDCCILSSDEVSSRPRSTGV